MLAVLLSDFGFRAFLPGQEETIECVLAGRDVLSVLPPRGGKTLCYALPSSLLPGTTVVLGGAAPQTRPRPRSPGSDKIIRVDPIQLYDSATVQLLSHCDISLLAIEDAERVSRWSPRYSPSHHAAARAVDTLRPQVTLALSSAAPRDVQGDIVCELGLLDAHRVSVPLELDGIFLEARVFADEAARLDALLALSEARDGRVCVVVGDEGDQRRLSARLVERGVPVEQGGGAGDSGIAVLASSSLENPNATAGPNVVFAHSPASLDDWLLEIGRLPVDGPACVGLYLVEGEAAREEQGAADGVSAGEIARLHALVAQHAEGRRLEMAEEVLADIAGMETASLADALGHLESLGALSRCPGRGSRVLNLSVELDSLSQDAVARIEQHLQRLREHRSLKADEVRAFARSRECRRGSLAEACGLSAPDGPCSQCDNCAPDVLKAASSRTAVAAPRAQAASGDAEGLVLECVRKLPLGVDKVQLVSLLSGTIPTSVAKQIDRDDFLGALEVLGGAQVREMVESMIAIGTLVERKIVVADQNVAIVEAADSSRRDSRGGLRIEARAARTASLEPSALSLRAVDFDLLAKLRDWRGETAYRIRIRPSEVVLDSDLRVIAQMKPQSVQELRDCVGASWQKARKWAQHLLRLVRSEEPGVVPPLSAGLMEPESLESLMASLNTDDARAKIDAIRALKAMGDPRCYGALDRISLDVSEPMLVRLYAGIAKRAVLKGPRPAASTAAQKGLGPGRVAHQAEPEGSAADAGDFKLRYPT